MTEVASAPGGRCGPACFSVSGAQSRRGTCPRTRHSPKRRGPAPNAPPGTLFLTTLICCTNTVNSEKRTEKKKGPLGLSPAPPGGRLRLPASPGAADFALRHWPPAGEGRADSSCHSSRETELTRSEHWTESLATRTA